MLKIKIKCLPSWDANAGTPLMMRIPSQVPKPYYLLCTSWSVFWIFLVLFLKPWRNVSLTCLMFFVLTRHKTVLKTMLLQSRSQSYLRGCLLGYSPQFGSDKTLFYSYYKLFTDYFCGQRYVSDCYVCPLRRNQEPAHCCIIASWLPFLCFCIPSLL